MLAYTTYTCMRPSPVLYPSRAIIRGYARRASIIINNLKFFKYFVHIVFELALKHLTCSFKCGRSTVCSLEIPGNLFKRVICTVSRHKIKLFRIRIQTC